MSNLKLFFYHLTGFNLEAMRNNSFCIVKNEGLRSRVAKKVECRFRKFKHKVRYTDQIPLMFHKLTSDLW